MFTLWFDGQGWYSAMPSLEEAIYFGRQTSNYSISTNARSEIYLKDILLWHISLHLHSYFLSLIVLVINLITRTSIYIAVNLTCNVHKVLYDPQQVK